MRSMDSMRRAGSALTLVCALAISCDETPTGPQLGTSNGMAACTDDAIAAGTSAGQQCVTFRALTGASMGGGAAARIGFAHPELFDSVAVMGTPLADLDAL